MNFNPLFPGMVCAMFGWNWTRGSEDEDENVESLRQRRHQGNNDDEQRTHFYQRSSCEFKTIRLLCWNIWILGKNYLHFRTLSRFNMFRKIRQRNMQHVHIYFYSAIMRNLDNFQKVPRAIKLNENIKTAIFQREGDISYIRLVIFYHRHTTTHSKNFMFIS